MVPPLCSTVLPEHDGHVCVNSDPCTHAVWNGFEVQCEHCSAGAPRTDSPQMRQSYDPSYSSILTLRPLLGLEPSDSSSSATKHPAASLLRNTFCEADGGSNVSASSGAHVTAGSKSLSEAYGRSSPVL